MTQYNCTQCDMSVKDLACGKCDAPLVHGSIDIEGTPVAVSKCPKGCGMIKSPQCCGEDMKPS